MFWRRGIARLAAAVGLLSVALPAVVPDAEAMVPMAVPASGLVGYWSFDDSVNFNVPDSGGSTLTKGNSASWSASGKFGGALSLSGASQSLYDTSSPAWLPVGNSSYTQSVWFKPAAVSGAGGLVGWGNYGSGRRTIALRMYENSGGFRHYWWGADLDCTGAQCPLSAGTWYHVASTWDGTTRKLYLNGVLKRSDTPGANNATAANFHIGKTCCSEYFTGLIDEVAIYNRAVTASEIAELSSSTDITAPTASVTTATLNPSQSATVQSTETGTAYLVKSTVSVTNEASITGAAANLWNSVTVTSANTNTPLALTGLVSGTYKAYAVDAAGNLSAASSNSVTVDADVPTVAVSRSGSGTVGGGQSVDITFTLSESTTEFTADDVTVSGGTLSGFTGSGASYTATWTPPATGSGTASISVTANKFTDAAGNQNTASAVLSIVWNADRPSVEITRTGSGTVGAGQTASLTFTLSEASTNFVSENVTVSSGTLSGFTGTGTTYTAVWTPPASGSGTASISVTANKFTDAAGNLNTASTALSIAWNTNPATTTTAAPALEIIVQVPTTTTVAPPGTSLSGGSSVPDVVVPPVGVTTSTSAVRSVPRAGAATTSTSSTVAVVVTTTTDALPRVPQVVTGAAAVETDGKKVPATVTREDNQIVVQAGPVTAKVAGVNEAGEPVSLDADGNIRIPAGSRVRIRASGFEPGSTVDGWLFSTPVRIGSATVDATGSVDTTFVIPAGTPAGAHRIAIEARTADGKPTTIAVGLRIGDFDKESNIATRLIIAALVLAILLAILLPAVSRRRPGETD